MRRKQHNIYSNVSSLHTTYNNLLKGDHATQGSHPAKANSVFRIDDSTNEAIMKPPNSFADFSLRSNFKTS